MEHRWSADKTGIIVPRATVIAAALFLWASAICTVGQVTYDGTLSSGPLSGPEFQILQAHGTTKGGNLFHSFSQFDLNASQSATFSGANSIRNVLARVTAGGASNIDGTIRSTINGANLYFMNPNGVIFGPNASIDVSGALAVTTANRIELAGGVRFTAAPGAGDALLTAANPVAFGFLTPNPAPVEFDGSTIETGGRLAIIAGDVTLTDAEVQAKNGRLDVVSAGSDGRVEAQLAQPFSEVEALNFARGGTVTMTNSVLRGDLISKVKIQGGELMMTASDIATSTSLGESGDVEIVLTGEAILNQSKIRTDGDGAETAGNIDIRADKLWLDGDGDRAGAAVQAESDTGRGGRIDIDVSGNVHLLNGAQIAAGADSGGRGGTIHLRAKNLVIDGNGQSTFIDAGPRRLVGGSQATGGMIDVEVHNQLMIRNRGRINNSAGPGSMPGAGSIRVSAKYLEMDGGTIGATAVNGDSGSIEVDVKKRIEMRGSEILSLSISSGSAGDIRVRADEINLQSGSRIRSDSNLSNGGNAGSVEVIAEKITISGRSSRISSLTGGSGTGGNIRVVMAKEIELRNSAEISSSSTGTGDAGSVTIEADHIQLRAGSAISSDTKGIEGGDAGNIQVQAGTLDLIAARISTNSSGESGGKAGDVQVRARKNIILGEDAVISSETTGLFGGDAGNVQVQAGRIDLNGAKISTNSSGESGGNAGDVRVRADKKITLGGGAVISSNSVGEVGGNAGNVRVRADKRIVLHEGAVISSDTEGEFGGDAGNVRVRAGKLDLNDAEISSDSVGEVGGNAGNVRVRAGEITMRGDSSISSDTKGELGDDAGNVRIRAGEIVLRRGASISSDTRKLSSGDAGSVVIDADRVSAFFSEISSGTSGRGDAGDVRLRSGQIRLGNGARIAADTKKGAEGDGGNIAVNARNAVVAGSRGKQASAIETTSKGTGRAGDIRIQAGNIRLSQDGLIASRSDQSGDAGKLEVEARNDLSLDGNAQVLASTGGTGKGGDLTVTVGNQLTADFNSVISTESIGVGDAGTVEVSARKITLNGGSRIDSNASGAGSAGDVIVRADAICLTGGGEIGANASGTGPGGFLTLETNDLLLSGGILASRSDQSGEAGSIDLKLKGSLTVEDGGGIEATTSGSGVGGNVAVEAAEVKILAGGSLSTSSTGSGDAGSVTVDTGQLTVADGGELASRNTGSGRAGSVFVRSARTIDFSRGARVSVEALEAEAGSVNLLAGGDLSFADSELTVASAGAAAGTARLESGGNLTLERSVLTAQSATTGGSLELIAPEFITIVESLLSAESQGSGGNLTLDGARFAILDDSVLSANAIQGAGGNILIGSEVLLTNNSPITASSQFGAEGTVRIDGIFDLSGALSDLDANLVDTEDELQPTCTVKIPGQTGSFILVGRGGQPILPGSFLPSHQLMPLPAPE